VVVELADVILQCTNTAAHRLPATKSLSDPRRRDLHGFHKVLTVAIKSDMGVVEMIGGELNPIPVRKDAAILAELADDESAGTPIFALPTVFSGADDGALVGRSLDWNWLSRFPVSVKIEPSAPTPDVLDRALSLKR